MQNFVQEGKTLTVIAPADLSSGDIFAVGELVGVAVTNAASGQKVAMSRVGVYTLPAKGINGNGNSAIVAGDKLYYVSGDTPAVSKKSSGLFVGYALEGVASSQTGVIEVLLPGSPGPGELNITPQSVTKTELADNAVETAKIKDAAVTKAKLAGGFLKAALISGDVAGDHTVTGIAAGDELVLVALIEVDTGALVDVDDLTSEFTIKAADTIENLGGTDTTGSKLLVLYLDLT